MDLAKDHKTLLLYRPPSEEEADAWARLTKALQTLGPCEFREESELAHEVLAVYASEFSHVFCDFSLVDFARLGESPFANLTLVKKDAFAWNSLRARELMGAALERHSSLLLEGTPTADLVRLLHLLLSPKRLPGVTPLLEKGALVVGEKVQSLDGVGGSLDRLSTFLSRIDDFSLGARIFDLRQALTSVVAEAFRRAAESSQPYPTVDFQAGATRAKLALNLRFPRGNLRVEELPRYALAGEELTWQQLWLLADVCLVIHHAQYDEVEVLALFNRRARPAAASFRSLLVKKTEQSAKREALLTAPANFDFHLLADVRLSQSDTVYLSSTLPEDNDIDLGNLPEGVVRRLSKLDQENEFFRDANKKKDGLLHQAIAKLTEANKEIAQKRTELLRIVKAKEALGNGLTRKLAELEKKLEQQSLSSTAALVAAAKEAASAGPGAAAPEALAKLEGAVKALENEKNQLVEKIAREEKKVAAFEQKYSALYKEILAKDKEMSELKGQLIKARKEQSAALAAAANATGGTGQDVDAMQAKIREGEAREALLKQDLKKLTFKVENNDKNVKAIQAESAEKAKLLEQKLSGAKAKEVELLKKIDELSGALKKAAKAG